MEYILVRIYFLLSDKTNMKEIDERLSEFTTEREKDTMLYNCLQLTRAKLEFRDGIIEIVDKLLRRIKK